MYQIGGLATVTCVLQRKYLYKLGTPFYRRCSYNISQFLSQMALPFKRSGLVRRTVGFIHELLFIALGRERVYRPSSL